MGLLLLLLASSGALLADDGIRSAMYQCKDSKTGRMSYRDTPCPASTTKVYGGEFEISGEELRMREESARQTKRELNRQVPGTYRPEEYMTAAEYQAYLDVERRLRNELQRSAVPTPAPSAPMPVTSVVCDRGGCWDDLGGRYDRAKGGTYFGPNSVCQRVGNMMQCP